MNAPLTSNLAVAAPPPKCCEKCGNELDWRDCWQCGGEGYTDHDCGEDCCCCLNPEPNVRCDECRGKGGWLQCRACYTGEDWDD